MKKHILFLLCLIAVSSTRAQVFADHFADKTLRVDISLTAMHPGKLSVWTGYPLSPPGQEESIIWRNSRCKATGDVYKRQRPVGGLLWKGWK